MTHMTALLLFLGVASAAGLVLAFLCQHGLRLVCHGAWPRWSPSTWAIIILAWSVVAAALLHLASRQGLTLRTALTNGKHLLAGTGLFGLTIAPDEVAMAVGGVALFLLFMQDNNVPYWPQSLPRPFDSRLDDVPTKLARKGHYTEEPDI